VLPTIGPLPQMVHTLLISTDLHEKVSSFYVKDW
jgi:hypothetical protein